MSIPLKIFQTYGNLTQEMKDCMDEIKASNPEFEHFFFNDQQCYDFIKDNFEEDVLNAYNSLKPKTYKADLWRYCVLYINGGVYLDIPSRPVNNFKFINFIDKDYFVRDTPLTVKKNKYFPVYNGLMICKPKNDILLKAINTIVENVKTKNYLDSPWAPTGPVLLGKLFTFQEKEEMIFRRFFVSADDNGVGMLDKDGKNKLVISQYVGYKDHKKKENYYVNLWEKGDIYN